MHAGALRDKAFRLWMEPKEDQSHRSYEEIATIVGVTKQTIVRWAKGDPKRGETNWEERRRRVTVRSEEKSDEDLAARKAKLAKKLRQLRDHLFGQALEAEISSAEGAVYAILGLVKAEAALTDQKISEPQLVQKVVEKVVPRVVISVCEFLSDDEAIRQKIDARKDELIKTVVEKLLSYATEEFKKTN